MPSFSAPFETLTPAAIVGLGSLGSGAAVLGGFTAEVDALYGLAAAVAAVSTAAALWSRRVATLPLRIAPSVTRSEANGVSQLRFRVMLGHGRPMVRPRARVRWHGGGTVTELSPLDHGGGPLIGPWTVSVFDRDGTCEGEGELELNVEAVEGGRTWAEARRWPGSAVRSGRFRDVVALRGGCVAWDRATWDEVVDDATAIRASDR